MNRVVFLRKRQKLYRSDPVLFMREVLAFEPDQWQAEAARNLAVSSKVSVRSGQGVGKTSLEAAMLLWFLTCYKYSRVVATAPTRQQLNDVLWSEVAKWQSRSPLLSVILKWTKTYIHMAGMEKRWFAVARTATKPENMQGFHEENMLFIVDEASGIAEPIMEAILGSLSGGNNKLLMCGNPTKTSGTFYDSHTKDRHLYKCHKVNALHSPRTNKENIEALIVKFGMDSSFVRVRVFGDFPLQEDDVFIPLALLEASVNYTEPRGAEAAIGSIHMGCDVARFGDDKTVIGYKVDERVVLHKKRHGQDLMKTADDIIELGMELTRRYGFSGRIPVKVDDGGLGGGVTDRLRQMKKNDPAQFGWLEVFPINFGRRIKHIYYHDSTSYMMGVLKKLLMPVEDDGSQKPVEIILPNDDDLIAQLSTRKYRLSDNGRIVIESKEAMKKRGLPSPDEADCVLLCCLPVRMKGEAR